MLFRIHDLEVQNIEFRESFSPGAIDLGPDIEQTAPLESSGHAELIEESHGGRHKVQDIRVVGTFSTRVEVRCARCLEPVQRDLGSSFDLLYRPAGIEGRPAESAVSEADTEIGFYRGEGLLLEDVLREQILLAVPIKLVCREECRGLCPGCGRNLNVEECVCPAPVGDPRWTALQDIKKRLES